MRSEDPSSYSAPRSARQRFLLLKWLVAGFAIVLATVVALPVSRAALRDQGHLLWVWQAQMRGINLDPVSLVRHPQFPLSPMASLGKQIFFDPSLSISGRQSCGTCHDPAHGYSPSNDLPAQMGGPELSQQGQRAVPGLTYVTQIPWFEVGPDTDLDETPEVPLDGRLPPDAQRPSATIMASSKVAAIVPRGGLFWDGRVNTLELQAAGPLLNAAEMGNVDLDMIAARLGQPPYRDAFAKLVGNWVLNKPDDLAREAMVAVARFQKEDNSFHAYTSKFDYWLEGKTRLTSQEMRGYRAFNDPKVGNCAACHLDKPHRNGEPPLFTDNQFEALAVPRNPELAANRDPAYFDLGICGPVRTDMRAQTQYCGMFRTPSLRNAAERTVFFHNGRYHTLQQVLEFYDFRETSPEKIYPRKADGSVDLYDDLPPQYRANVDLKDAPFDRHAGDRPAMSERDMDDIVAFLKTLTDGYQPAL